MSLIFLTLYFFAGAVVMIYAINCYVMLYLHKRKKKNILDYYSSVENNLIERADAITPFVTTQIPVFNEYNVIERCLKAVCEIDYPKDKHEIQILDDSNDSTSSLIDSEVAKLKEQGYVISVFRRNNRTGFKAGALAEAMSVCKGAYIAIFDADFKPQSDFLKKVMPHFINNENIALVQTRWEHLNKNKSILTQAQAIGIDGHFTIEQSARCWNDLYMNFNGTAGVWKKEAIVSGGGWECDTLTEDMDLSYRVQLKGWQTVFLPNVSVPAEIPEDIRAFKSQQFRWAKGSIQTAIKLFTSVSKCESGFFKKIQAWFHMTHYLIHPFMVMMSILALPTLLVSEIYMKPILYYSLMAVLTFSIMAPNALYCFSIYSLNKESGWWKRLRYLPALTMIGVGVAVNNTLAVIEAVMGKKSGFVRTPKTGDQKVVQYKVKFDKTMFIELGLGLYSMISLVVLCNRERYLITPFMAIYGIGYTYVGLRSMFETLLEKRQAKRTALQCESQSKNKNSGHLEAAMFSKKTLTNQG